jgi:hypothetical protein
MIDVVNLINYMKNLIGAVKEALPLLIIGTLAMVEIVILFDYHYGILRRRNR